jgi:hypothetical protein
MVPFLFVRHDKGLGPSVQYAEGVFRDDALRRPSAEVQDVPRVPEAARNEATRRRRAEGKSFRPHL